MSLYNSAFKAFHLLFLDLKVRQCAVSNDPAYDGKLYHSNPHFNPEVIFGLTSGMLDARCLPTASSKCALYRTPSRLLVIWVSVY
jgi:hypothetical protein